MTDPVKIDKSKWPAGPWMDEPDWLHFKTGCGYEAAILRNALGALCGYVGIPETHPYYGQTTAPVDVHGDLTYAQNGLQSFGENTDLWYFGFDCAHYNDIVPAMQLYFPALRFVLSYGCVYRDIEYVTQEVESLSGQLEKLALPKEAT